MGMLSPGVWFDLFIHCDPSKRRTHLTCPQELAEFASAFSLLFKDYFYLHVAAITNIRQSVLFK